MDQLLTDRYRPETLDGIRGNDKNVKKIRQWAEDWKNGKQRKPLLLHGEPGTGKTSAAFALSKEYEWPLNQINASDSRKSDDLERLAVAIQSNPTDAEHQLVLLDEVDSFPPRVRYADIQESLKNPNNPVICTANEHWNVPNWLSNNATNYKFSLTKASRKKVLKEIAEAEGYDMTDQEINKLADRPDLRSAINDLSVWGDADIPPDVDQRSWDVGPFTAIRYLINGDSRWGDVTSASDGTFSPPDMLMWTAENIPSHFRGLEGATALRALRAADRCLADGQAIDYRYWKFANAHFEALPETRLTKPYKGYVRIDTPSWYSTSQKSAHADTPEARAFRKMKGEWGFRFAGSFYEFRNDILPILKDMPIDEKRQMAMNYGLESDELEVLGLDSSDFEDWAVPQEMTEGKGWQPQSSSAADW